jgi:hypothetical protein
VTVLHLLSTTVIGNFFPYGEYLAKKIRKNIISADNNTVFIYCCIFLGDSPASKFYMPTFRKILFHVLRLFNLLSPEFYI